MENRHKTRSGHILNKKFWTLGIISNKNKKKQNTKGDSKITVFKRIAQITLLNYIRSLAVERTAWKVSSSSIITIQRTFFLKKRGSRKHTGYMPLDFDILAVD